jgi:hypothetical protein
MIVSANRKLFSKVHKEIGQTVSLRQGVRQRIWLMFEDMDPLIEPFNKGYIDYTISRHKLEDKLRREHGWSELRAYQSRTEWEKVNPKDFILRGVARFVLDAIELYQDLLLEEIGDNTGSRLGVKEYENGINRIFEEDSLPWRLLDGRIVKLDSQFVETEILAKAHELISAHGFEGALREFLEARTNLASGDTKGAIRQANLALESTMKGILGVERAKPGELVRKIIESGMVPDYHDGFLEAFEQHILRSVPIARNEEKGVGHGQGCEVNDPPLSLAELAVHLSGVLVLYLMKRHIEKTPRVPPPPPEDIDLDLEEDEDFLSN